MFDVDLNGFFELEGGKPAHRLAFEPVSNGFDERRGYVEGRKRPSWVAVTLAHQNNPRGVMLTVADDGPGFMNERDVYTLFGSTPKRGVVGVAGRFNSGDKQLIAVARWARVRTNDVTVEFADGKREVTKHRTIQFPGTMVEALMRWSLNDMEQVREHLRGVLPPDGLAYTVDGQTVTRPPAKCTVKVSLPTVKLQDGVLRDNKMAKTDVTVLKTPAPTLFELGIPVCELADLGFPWSLDVQQKVPVPSSRDTVSPAYLYQLTGKVLKQAAMDGITLLTREEKGAPFVKGALGWIRNPDALKATVEAIYGPNLRRRSSNSKINALAELNNITLVDSRDFSEPTRRVMDETGILPPAKDLFDSNEADGPPKPKVVIACPNCGAVLN